MFSCFLLDSFELQEIVCLKKNWAVFSSLNISRQTYCFGYDVTVYTLLTRRKYAAGYWRKILHIYITE